MIQSHFYNLHTEKKIVTLPKSKPTRRRKYLYDVTTSAIFAYEQNDQACRSTHSAGSSSDFRQSMKTRIVSAKSFAQLTVVFFLLDSFFFFHTIDVFLFRHIYSS